MCNLTCCGTHVCLSLCIEILYASHIFFVTLLWGIRSGFFFQIRVITLFPPNTSHSQKSNITYSPKEVYPCSQPSWQLRPLSWWLGWHQSKKSGVPGWEWVLLQARPFALWWSSNGSLPQTTWPAWWSSELCPPVWKQDHSSVRDTLHSNCRWGQTETHSIWCNMIWQSSNNTPDNMTDVYVQCQKHNRTRGLGLGRVKVMSQSRK